MPLYHKKPKSKPSFISTHQSYTRSFLDKSKSLFENPSVKAYSKSLADVLARPANSDKKIVEEAGNLVAQHNTTAKISASRDTTIRDIASPLSESIFSSPSDFESVEISRVKTLNGKTVKTFTRVESSCAHSPNTDANMIKIASQNDSPKSTLSNMLNDCVKSNLRLGQQLMNVDELVALKNDQIDDEQQFKSELKTQISEPKTENVQGLKKTLSRFISNFNFMKTEPKTQITQNIGLNEQSITKQTKIAENQSKSILREKSVENVNNLKEKSQFMTGDEIKSKPIKVDDTKKGQTKSRELQEITDLNNRLSQEYFKNVAEKPDGDGNPSKKPTKNKIKKNKSEKAKKKQLKNKNDKSNWDQRVEQDVSLEEDITQVLLKKNDFKKPTKSKKNKYMEEIQNRPESDVSELEALTEFNNILSQEYFKKLDSQKDKRVTVKKDKVKIKKNKSNLTEPYKKSKKRTAVDEIQSPITKKSKKHDHNFKKSKKNVIHQAKKTTMIHTFKRNMGRYKSEGFINHMIELQNQRDVGIYVYCDNCNKIRHLPDVKDPLDLPGSWYCYMNPDKDFKNCDAPDYEVPPEEEERFIKNKFNAGSVVWAKLEGYPWWPALVEDDPDIEDFYWLDDIQDDEPTWYHVTFFDTQKVTRAWVKTKYLEPFALNHKNRYFLPKPNDFFKQRIESSIVQALEACKMELLPRLRKYSFVTRYIKPKKAKKVCVDRQKKVRRVVMENIPNLSQSSVKSSESFSQVAKPKKMSKYSKILSENLEDEILKDVDINQFINQDIPAEINFDTIE